MSLQLRSVARPYARAMFDIAQAQNSLSSTRKELEKVGDLIDASSDFQRFVASPVVTADERRAVVAEIAKRLQLSKTVTNFLSLLADKHRLAALTQIVELFEEEADRAEGIFRAEAYAPVKLSAVQIDRLRAALEEMTGKKIVVKGHVDASLMGGLLVKVNGEVYDNTVKSQLTALRQHVLRI